MKNNEEQCVYTLLHVSHCGTSHGGLNCHSTYYYHHTSTACSRGSAVDTSMLTRYIQLVVRVQFLSHTIDIKSYVHITYNAHRI